MRKRVLTVVLMICLCLSASACGGSNEIGSDINKKIGRFQSYDLSGKEVTEAVFSQKDLTVLIVWGTFCSKYIDKMSAVNRFAEDLPENAQLITLACEVRDLESKEYSKALSIMTLNKAKYPCIITTDSLTVFVDQFKDVPTALLIDRKGNVTGQTFKGEDVAGYSAAAEEYLGGL